MTEPLTPAFVQAQISWEDVDRVPVLAANQFAVQMEAATSPSAIHDVVLTVGYLSPPMLSGTPEEQQKAARALERLSIRPIARFSVPADRAAELAQIIQELLRRVGAGGEQS